MAKVTLANRIKRKIRFLYRKHFLETVWQLNGGRRMVIFGMECLFTASSSIFEYKNVKVPKETILDDITSYTDYVQLRAIVREAQLLVNRPVVVDIGAFHGAYAVILGKIVQRKGGRLIAVEPHPEQFHTMLDNVRLNGLEDTVICRQVAVADYTGDARLRCGGNQSVLDTGQGDDGVTVEVVTLSDLLRKHDINKVDILMMDVEGAELLVLRGSPWNAVRIEKVFCEMHPYAWKNFGYSGRDVGQFIRDNGFRCFDMFLQEHTQFPEELFYMGPTVLFPVNASQADTKSEKTPLSPRRE